MPGSWPSEGLGSHGSSKQATRAYMTMATPSVYSIATLRLQVCKYYLFWALKYINGTYFELFEPQGYSIMYLRYSLR